jgi:hypothetical protein
MFGIKWFSRNIKKSPYAGLEHLVLMFQNEPDEHPEGKDLEVFARGRALLQRKKVAIEEIIAFPDKAAARAALGAALKQNRPESVASHGTSTKSFIEWRYDAWKALRDTFPDAPSMVELVRHIIVHGNEWSQVEMLRSFDSSAKFVGLTKLLLEVAQSSDVPKSVALAAIKPLSRFPNEEQADALREIAANSECEGQSEAIVALLEFLPKDERTLPLAFDYYKTLKPGHYPFSAMLAEAMPMGAASQDFWYELLSKRVDDEGKLICPPLRSAAAFFGKDKRFAQILREIYDEFPLGNVRELVIIYLAYFCYDDPQTSPLLWRCIISDAPLKERQTAFSWLITNDVEKMGFVETVVQEVLREPTELEWKLTICLGYQPGNIKADLPDRVGFPYVENNSYLLDTNRSFYALKGLLTSTVIRTFLNQASMRDAIISVVSNNPAGPFAVLARAVIAKHLEDPSLALLLPTDSMHSDSKIQEMKDAVDREKRDSWVALLKEMQQRLELTSSVVTPAYLFEKFEKTRITDDDNLELIVSQLLKHPDKDGACAMLERLLLEKEMALGGVQYRDAWIDFVPNGWRHYALYGLADSHWNIDQALNFGMRMLGVSGGTRPSVRDQKEVIVVLGKVYENYKPVADWLHQWADHPNFGDQVRETIKKHFSNPFPPHS